MHEEFEEFLKTNWRRFLDVGKTFNTEDGVYEVVEIKSFEENGLKTHRVLTSTPDNEFFEWEYTEDDKKLFPPDYYGSIQFWEVDVSKENYAQPFCDTPGEF